MNPPSLQLLSLMRAMHASALESNWDRVADLNKKRDEMLDNTSNSLNEFAEYSPSVVQEILLLDQHVMTLTQRALTTITEQASSVSKQTAACQTYQHISNINVP